MILQESDNGLPGPFPRVSITESSRRRERLLVEMGITGRRGRETDVPITWMEYQQQV